VEQATGHGRERFKMRFEAQAPRRAEKQPPE
jgi:hypothetical protein